MAAKLEVDHVTIQYITGDFKDIGLKEFVMRKLTRTYRAKSFLAVNDVSFSLLSGDMLGIVGSNGAGKSTLLKAVSQIMIPSAGSITLHGKVVALLELGSGFDGDLTVKENAYLRGAMLGYTRQFMNDKYQEIIDFAELNDFEDRPFRQLSSGMKSRLAFSIASMVNPEILILDEVLSVGDGAFRKRSEEKMMDIIYSGATTILVSHAVPQIRSLCNKVLWLDHGRQIAFGYTNPICDAYEKYLQTKILPRDTSAWSIKVKKKAILFSGQGAQKVGMLKDLFDANSIIRDTFIEAEEVLEMPIRSLCFDGPQEELDLTENTQPCVVTAEIAIYRLLTSLKFEPSMLCGFSLGECSALIAAGVIKFSDGLKLVKRRAQAMQAAVPAGEGGMLAVLGLDEATLRVFCQKVGDGFWPANYNCPGQIVCAGRTDALERAEILAHEQKIRVMRLSVSIPSHCCLMQSAADQLADYLKEIIFSKPAIPIVTNVDAMVTREPDALKKKLILQLTQPVWFEKCLHVMEDSGIDSFIEAGPGKILSGFVKKSLDGISCEPVNDENSFVKLLK